MFFWSSFEISHSTSYTKINLAALILLKEEWRIIPFLTSFPNLPYQMDLQDLFYAQPHRNCEYTEMQSFFKILIVYPQPMSVSLSSQVYQQCDLGFISHWKDMDVCPPFRMLSYNGQLLLIRTLLVPRSLFLCVKFIKGYSLLKVLHIIHLLDFCFSLHVSTNMFIMCLIL